MTLTTPPMASEPYSAEAPSERISMRSTAASGMVLRSALLPVDGAYGTRRPSTSTRVRSEPMPRRSMSAVAWAELPDCGRKLPNDENVESRSTSATDTSPLASMAARAITVSGTAPSMSARRMREPVTWMRARVWVSSAGAAWAPAGSAGSAQAMAIGSAASPRPRARNGDGMRWSPEPGLGALNAASTLRRRCRCRLPPRAGPVCRMWRDGHAVARWRHAEARTEGARETAVVLEAAGRARLAHRQPGAAQQPRRVRQAQAAGGRLRAFAVKRLEGLGEVPDRDAAQAGEFGNAH